VCRSNAPMILNWHAACIDVRRRMGPRCSSLVPHGPMPQYYLRVSF
jgi:hypothetical protein